MSCVNFVSLLAHTGIDINYAGMNLTTIDSTASWRVRTKLTIDLVDKLYYNIEDIWHSNKEQLLYNQKLLQSDQLEKTILLNIQDHL